MKPDEVLAVVVSYNGKEKTSAAVDALVGQVGGILVVDNGSSADSLQILNDIERRPGVIVTRLTENRGIGHALNLGVGHARRHRFTWLLTMDQDSIVDQAMILAYQSALARNPSLVSLAPTTLDVGHDTNGPARENYAITSGHLVRLTVFDDVGLYDDGFFVDCIDFDFSLKLRRAGHEILRVPEARMQHRVGEAIGAPRVVRKFYTHHPPVRRYYMYRNYMYLAERHIRRFPIFILKLGFLQLVLLALMAFYDAHPIESYRAVLRGWRDYFARVDGPARGFA